MKHLVFAIIERHTISVSVLEALSKAGFNGTVVPSTSLKHSILEHGEIPMMFNLSHMDHDNYTDNTTLFLVVNEEDVIKVQEIIREYTEHFTNTHGGMFVVPLESYEGSF